MHTHRRQLLKASLAIIASTTLAQASWAFDSSQTLSLTKASSHKQEWQKLCAQAKWRFGTMPPAIA